jgi:ubiquinone/menaquinone biosynthesis C-methylase UbiE
MSFIVRFVGGLHQRLVKPRQSQRIVDYLAEFLPVAGRVLDIGCGTGKISRLLMERNPKLNVEGIDILVQPRAEIEVKAFDGERIPFADKVFDAVIFVDVLHHTNKHAALLKEAVRVSKGAVVVKDHICRTTFDFVVLAFMDWVGNRSLGIRSIHNYYSQSQWRQLFESIGVAHPEVTWVKGLYPFPFNLIFERNKQVIFRLMAVCNVGTKGSL